MTLETIFPEIGKKQRYAHYRGSLLYRGMTPSQERQQAIDPEMVRIEQSRGFPRPGLYLKRLRFLMAIRSAVVPMSHSILSSTHR